MEHVGFCKVDEAISICMGRRCQKSSNLFAIKMEAHGVVESYKRSSCGRLLWAENASGSGATKSFLEKAQARVVVSKDHHAHLRQIFIAASMIAMNMSVDQKANFFVGHLLDGCY